MEPSETELPKARRTYDVKAYADIISNWFVSKVGSGRKAAHSGPTFPTIAIVAVLLLAASAYYAWSAFSAWRRPLGIATGNGRIEAVEIDVSTKTPGRIKEILANEGDFVKAGQILARMDTEVLEAQRRQANAQLQRAIIGIETAKSVIRQREAERRSAAAVVAQREAQLGASEKKLARSEELEHRAFSWNREIPQIGEL